MTCCELRGSTKIECTPDRPCHRQTIVAARVGSTTDGSIANDRRYRWIEIIRRVSYRTRGPQADRSHPPQVPRFPTGQPVSFVRGRHLRACAVVRFRHRDIGERQSLPSTSLRLDCGAGGFRSVHDRWPPANCYVANRQATWSRSFLRT